MMINMKKLGKKGPIRDENDSEAEEGLLDNNGDDEQAQAEARNSIEGMVDDIENLDYLDEHDPLDDDFPSRLGTKAYAEDSKLTQIRKKYNRLAKWLTLGLVFVACVWTVLALGNWWVHASPPKDGESPPWYPTPKGGTLGDWAESYKKAAALVEKMSLVSKVNITTGTGWQMGLAVGNTGPADDVGFPGLALQDGPLGLRFADRATAFPAGVTVGATWNKSLMYARGRAHGTEARLKGINVLLGPCVGPLGRMPAGGRNWEGFGADPYLQGIAAAESIRGIQDEGVIATIKHYIGNEQEHFRQSWEWLLPNAMSSNIGDRTLHELYLWPFADAVKAGVGSVMCSYQMTNNSYSCGNAKLLNGILKDELGFQGFVQSDWLAQRSGVASALAGLDMSMPGDGYAWTDGKPYWGSELTRSVLNGSLPLSRLNDMVTRVVATWYQLGQDDTTKFDGKGPNFSSWTDEKMGHINQGSSDDTELVEVNKFVDVQGDGENAHKHIARQVAAEGSVLVKNIDNILPLSRDGKPGSEIKYRVGIFGDDAGDGKYHDPNHCPDRSCNEGTLGSGWGSGAAEFPYLITPIAALKDAFNKEKVYVTDFPSNDPPLVKAPAIVKDQDLCLVFVNADAGEGYLSYEKIRGDRNDLDIQHDGDALVLKVAENCGGGEGKTVVVVHSVGPVVLEKWIDHPNVHAVIMANLPGQESGNAIADVLFGDVNPSGKLPYTISKSLDDFGVAGQILYLPKDIKSLKSPQQNFSEGVYIDYRHFDKYSIAPRFEFGFGLSYTTFEYTSFSLTTIKPKSPFPARRPSPMSPPKYSEAIPDPSTAIFPPNIRKLKKFIYPYIASDTEISTAPYPYPEGYTARQPLSPAGGGLGGNPSLYDIHLNVSFTLTNTGTTAGSEVAQLYLSYPGSKPSTTPPPTKDETWKFTYDNDMTDFPVRVLRGFEKIHLQPGESQTVSFALTRRDLSYWDVHEQNWRMLGGATDTEKGEYKIAIGASSRDLRLEGLW